MAIEATAAAKTLQDKQNDISSHQVISLLMDGGLERLSQARSALAKGDGSEAEMLVQKIIGIINGLRVSLNFEQGGDIAKNLDTLYDYMLDRIENVDATERLVAVEEVSGLLSEVKQGWDDIDA